MFLKYLAKMDLILILSKFPGPKSNRFDFCVPFDNLTNLVPGVFPLGEKRAW
jgi:hypothetical protein